MTGRSSQLTALMPFAHFRLSDADAKLLGEDFGLWRSQLPDGSWSVTVEVGLMAVYEAFRLPNESDGDLIFRALAISRYSPESPFAVALRAFKTEWRVL